MRAPPRSARPIDVLGFGEASIDEVWRLPPGLVLGGKGRAIARDRLGGGQIATALCAAARLGARARYLGPIGDDALGDEIARGLAEDGVTLAPVARIAGARSRVALVLVDRDGERTVIEDGGAPAHVGEEAVAELARARALHVDGTRPEAALALARAARQAGTLVSIDVDALPASGDVDALRGSGDVDALPSSAALRALIALADVCVLPRGLPAALTGAASTEAALPRLAAQGPPGALIVETRGADGAIALGPGGVFAVPAAATAAGVVDTTACGDTFRAALLCALLDGTAARDALDFAAAAAALKCRAVGRRGCPTRAEVEALRPTRP